MHKKDTSKDCDKRDNNNNINNVIFIIYHNNNPNSFIDKKANYKILFKINFTWKAIQSKHYLQFLSIKKKRHLISIEKIHSIKNIRIRKKLLFIIIIDYIIIIIIIIIVIITIIITKTNV